MRWMWVMLAMLAGWPMGAAELPEQGWKAERREVTGLTGERRCVLVAPGRSRAEAHYASPEAFSPGVYRVRVMVRPSHVSDGIAWATTLRVSTKSGRILGESEQPGVLFARVHQPEVFSFEIAQDTLQPLSFTLEGVADAAAIEQARATQAVKAGSVATPTLSLDGGGGAGIGDALGGLDMSFEINPSSHVYYLIDRAEVERLTGSAYVASLEIDKVRYAPGSALKATVRLQPVAGATRGTLRLLLEHGVGERETVAEQAVELPRAATLEVKVQLPQRELGHALIAQWSAAEEDRHELADVFNITTHPWRAGIFFVRPIHTETAGDDYTAYARRLKHNYYNVREFFFWAEDDMVAMSPETDYWFSGQTTYHLRKQGLKRMIEDYQAHGIAASSYGKFQMSGYLGWRTAYDYPFDHKQQYSFPLGMWEGTDVPALDRFKGKEFAAVVPSRGGLLGNELGGLPFLPITPDSTPRNVHTAAMEAMRAIEMFNWDAIRWDGHMRGLGAFGNSCGGARPDKYDYEGHRRTQLLVRYFKDLVNARYPDFGHGYNYFFATDNPEYDWAVEDFELDELAHGGGLLMNESIGNHSFGKPISWFVSNLQEEGDLSRERGAFYLAIGRSEQPRDNLLQTILWYAAGARPYGNTTENRLLNRYATRYSRYVFDESLTRLDKAASFIRPAEQTPLWYDPFVYVTRADGGQQEMVINLLNIRSDLRMMPKGEKEGDMSLLPGTDPVTLALDLPAGMQITAARLINPWTLEVEPLEHTASEVSAPPVALWRVVVLDLTTGGHDTVLAERYGPPQTLGKKREKLAVERREFDPFDLTKDVTEVNKNMASMFANDQGGRPWWQEREELAGLSMAERNAVLLAAQQPADSYIKGYPYGVRLPDDLKLKDAPPNVGNMTPLRNGRLDLFLARGAMDYRLRLYEAFGQLGDVQVTEGRYVAPFSGRHHGMEKQPSPAQIAEQDLIIVVDVPHAGLGVQQSYAMVPWIKAGGAAYFFGGEYAFGKGRYAHTVLDRELLPVISVEARDNRYVQDPLALEIGPDFAELGLDIDLAAAPVFWAWNQVALRPDAEVKVFLQAGNRPILVGYELGQGRVACWLAMHRGTSTEEHLAFVDWQEWPTLTAAVIRWLTPHAAQREADPRRLAAPREDELTTKLSGGLLDSILAGGDGDAFGADGAAVLPDNLLRERVTLIRQLLRWSSPATRQLLGEQLIQVANLPLALRLQIMRKLAWEQPESLPQGIDQALSDSESDIRAGAAFLLALQGDGRFERVLLADSTAMEANPINRRRLLALSIAVWPDDALVAEGKRRVAAWNAREAGVRRAYTKGEGFSMAAPEVPLLDSESYFERVCWLAYLATREPAEHAAAFVREWAMLPQYADWCNRSITNIDEGLAQGAPSPVRRQAAEQQKRDLRLYIDYVYHTAAQLQPAAEAAMANAPEAAATGMLACNFRLEAIPMINLLAGLPAEARPSVGNILRDHQQYLLREFLTGARWTDD